MQAIVAAHGTFSPMLLHGITGSGKTDVYLAAATHVVARGGQVLILVPEINLTPQFERRVRDALPGVHAVTLHSRLASGVRRANWDAASNATRKGRARDATRRIRAVAATRAGRRRRGARRLVQAAGRRSLSRARSRRVASAQAQRADRAGQRDAVARDVVARQGRSLPCPCARRARGRPRASSRNPVRAGTRQRRARRIVAVAARCARGAPSQGRAGAAVHQPAWLRAVAQVRGLHVGIAMSALFGTPGGASAAAAVALPSLRAHEARLRARVPIAATSTCCRSASARSGSSNRFASHFPARESRASTAIRRATRARSPQSASRWKTARSTSWSARRCLRRGTIFPGSRSWACWAPTTRSTAPISAPPSGSPRC